MHDNDHDVKYLMNVDNLKKDINNFVTNPSYVVFDDYDDSFIEIYSGDRIEEYSCMYIDIDIYTFNNNF